MTGRRPRARRPRPTTDRQVTTLTLELTADCTRCPWTTRAHNGLGNAARHHDATGHPVTVEVTRRVTYGDPTAPPEGQEELFTA